MDSELFIDYDLKLGEKYTSLISDASDMSSFIFNADSSCYMHKEFIFSPTEILMSSGQREMLALLKLLETKPDYFKELEGNIIVWLTDSRNACKFLRNGSRIPQINNDVLKIKTLEANYKIKIVVTWVPRTNALIQMADLGSRLKKSTDEWSISEFDFAKIEEYFQVEFSIDAFATSSNAKCEIFYSPIPMEDSSGIDFFNQEIQSDKFYWICPPVSLLSATIKHLKRKRHVKGVLFFPCWKLETFCYELCENFHFQKFVVDFLIMNPFFRSTCERNIFSGYKPFLSLAILFDMNANCRRKIPENISNVLIKKSLYFTRNIIQNRFFLPNNFPFPNSRIILENYFK